MTRLFLQDCGVICPIGRGKGEVAAALRSGSRAGLTPRDGLLPGRPVLVGAVGGSLPALPEECREFHSRNCQLMLSALTEIAPALEQAIARWGPHRIAVIIGTSTSGIAEGETALAERRETGHWPSTFQYRQQELGSAAAFVAKVLGVTGPAYTIATACSSSAKVFASARRLIRMGLVDAAVVGGVDTLCRTTLNGFASLQALSRGLCNPMSANRDGINIGEGAAAFLVSSAPGPVELLGVGENSDAHHPTAPEPEGRGARDAMAMALDDAGITPKEICYVNLHGTGTALNDAMESKAVAALFGGATACSSTKGMTGHMLGATGGVEAAFLWLALNPGSGLRVLPPHVWDGAQDPALPPLNLIGAETPSPTAGRLAMLSNSFGFGGSNVSLILGRA